MEEKRRQNKIRGSARLSSDIFMGSEAQGVSAVSSVASTPTGVWKCEGTLLVVTMWAPYNLAEGKGWWCALV